MPARPFLPVVGIGEALLWIAALLTLVTGYDYLRAGLSHMGRAPAAAARHAAKPQHARREPTLRRAPATAPK